MRVFDRLIRELLRHLENLRSYLEQTVPTLAPGFDCGGAGAVAWPRVSLDDWRWREADLPFEIPHLAGLQ
jgi:hypothetical protein